MAETSFTNYVKCLDNIASRKNIKWLSTKAALNLLTELLWI